MKKTGISIFLALVFGLAALAGCGVPASRGDEAEVPEGGPSVSEELPEQTFPEEPPAEEPEGRVPEAEVPKAEVPDPAMLALLDTLDVAAALGDRGEEGWSFALKAAGEMKGSYGFSLYSELTDREKLDMRLAAGLGLEDLIGLRSREDGTEGIDLFGGGKASLTLSYRGPKSDSEPVEEALEAGFRHGGDLVWFAGEAGEEGVPLEALEEELRTRVPVAAFERMERAFSYIPEQVGKGVSLRLAVEDLLELGFSLQIDDSEGLKITLRANEAFYTNLFNDLLEELIPADWLVYLPRLDFGYEKTFFDIVLAFGEDGTFAEYSMSSDVAVSASLEVRGLFVSSSKLTAAGGFSFTAYSGEVPGYGGAPEE